jgi:hypothetical protein
MLFPSLFSCYKCFADERTLLEHIPRHKESKHLKASAKVREKKTVENEKETMGIWGRKALDCWSFGGIKQSQPMLCLYKISPPKYP